MKIFLLLILLSCQTQHPDLRNPFVFEQCERREIERTCFCREYEYSKSRIAAISKKREMPLEHCDIIVGESPSEYVRKTNFLETVRLEITKP